MEYSKIVSVTGLPGLFELVSTKPDGAVVRSLDDKTTRFASSRVHNFSHLETIEVYTVSDNVNLAEVFQAMEKDSGSLPDTKDNDAIKKYFEKVYGDIDFERVYNSDLKKMIKWFEVLKKNNVEIKLSEPEPEEEKPKKNQNALNQKIKKNHRKKRQQKKRQRLLRRNQRSIRKEIYLFKNRKACKEAAKKKGK